MTARREDRPAGGPELPAHAGSAVCASQQVPIPGDRVSYLVGTAARAPSVHNTQPWRFVAGTYQLELHADTSRKLSVDPAGREMLISCGGALFGLRLAIRGLGYLPDVRLLPDPARPGLLAQVALGQQAPPTALERQLLAAIPHRHTHRGPFRPGALPAGLLVGLQHDARAEGAGLELIDRPGRYQQLAALASESTRRLGVSPIARAEVRRWTHAADQPGTDGLPALAFPAALVSLPGRLPQRDFDLGRGLGLVRPGGPPAAATAVLVTPADTPADWLRAGQALHRLLLRAAVAWVFASLHTQPLEVRAIRALVRSRLSLMGQPQLVLQFGRSGIAQPTGRRPVGELLI